MKKIIPIFKMLLDSGESFTVECTKNFYNIKHKESSYKFFSGSKPNFSVFNISRKLKKELTEKNREVTNLNIEEYFRSNQEFDFDINDEFYCIDIKQAYVTIMKNRNLISKNMFDDICSLKKPDRLKVLGMLARRKTKYTYANGVMVESVLDKLPTEKYFFWCVEQTYLLMSDIARKIGSDFVFFWVDCVFFVGRKNINYVIDRLKSERLGFTLERLIPTGISESKSHYTFSFLKKGKKKDYNVPKIKESEILSKVKHCFVTEDFKGFKHYMNEYETICKGISN